MKPLSTLLRPALACVVAAGTVVSVATGPSAPVAHAAPTADEALVVVLEGQGNGHGRGLSQWGSYGWATAYGKDWTWILDHYYGGTQMGTVPGDQRMTTRLLSLDGYQTSVIAPLVDASVNGTGAYASVTSRLVSGTQQFDVWASMQFACPSSTASLGSNTPTVLEVPDGPIARGTSDTGSARQIQAFLTRAASFLGDASMNPGGIDGLFGGMTEAAVIAFQNWATSQGSFTGAVDGVWGPDTATVARSVITQMPVESTSDWVYLGRYPAGSNGWAVTVTTPGGDSPSTPAEYTLGVCQKDSSIRHYRGSMIAAYASGSSTPQRTVNDAPIEMYLRGVVPRESPASWGDAAGGAGINALRAQSVAARSYGLAQSRYSYAKSCDTTSCQVYGGAATRGSATGVPTVIEDARTNRAIDDTALSIRVRPGTTAPVSTEFSSSNGDKTAGGAFPSVDDDGDKIDANPWNRWTRVLSVSGLASRYGLSTITNAANETDTTLAQQGFLGLWATRTRLYNGSNSVTVTHASLRNAYDLPSIAFTARVVRRDRVTTEDFAFIGDSVGESIADRDGGGELPALLSGVFGSAQYDALTNRCTVGSCVTGELDGLGVARALTGTPDVVVVELGYNDSGSSLAGEIDQVMQALVDKGVRAVGWVTMSERRTSNGSATYASHNRAVRAAADKWPQLRVLDWNAASSAGNQSRWFNDGVHLNTSGQAQFALWLRERVLEMAGQVEQTRVYGDTRYTTAIEIATRSLSGGAVASSEVVVVNGLGTVDGLAASGYAGSRRAPILLTQADALPATVSNYLAANQPVTVTIVGGTNAVQPVVEEQIRALLPSAAVVRIQGADRYRTAEQLARTVFADAGVLFIAAGSSQVDALSIAPAAFALADPLLLATPAGIDAETLTAITEWWESHPNGRVVLVGGTTVLSPVVDQQLFALGVPEAQVTRLAGENRYATSALAVEWIKTNVTGFNSGSVGLASGKSPIDSLTSAPFLAGNSLRSPLLLVPPCGTIPDVTKTALLSTTKQIVIGGPAAVCEALALALKQR
ncbi:MAG: cell wall-binding repeat-containing protein [Ilumatobacteraceae bacterium]